MAFALRLVLLLCGITGSCSFVLYTGPSCPDGWTRLNHRCFNFLNENFRFADAETFCNALGGNLVSIHSQLENEVVRFLIEQGAGSARRTWIGFHDTVREGEFVWTDGSVVDFTDWANNRPRMNDMANCAEINFQGETWNDVRCSRQRSIVCTKDVKY
uniref:galactose-specific lectin nattectin-like n=1 Tax=Doryrhamphus excisus TaxID=161450 RepID=UPI0025AE20B7|nr:galactose-specific lectin nattectin-like [Doryrhamphus excisus]